jgi:hypothetical protein
VPERRAHGVASRIRGRGAIVRSLQGLLIRVHRFGRLRATADEERRWAGRLIDRLEVAVREAMETPEVRASLHAAERRAAVSRKCRPVAPPPAV